MTNKGVIRRAEGWMAGSGPGHDEHGGEDGGRCVAGWLSM
jgi:hypothetical protein